MKFQNFLTTASNAIFWQTKKVFCFHGKECPLLFFQLMWTRFSDTNVLPFTKKGINVETIKDNFDQVLGQSILGMYNFYWLGDLSDQNKNDKLISYILKKYQGPHHLSFFTSHEIEKTKLSLETEVIEISTSLTFSDFNNLLQIFGNNIPYKKLCVARQIFDEQKELGLDKCCMLINYLELASLNLTENLSEYIDQIIGSQPAINQLSNYFFANQSKAFFALWAKLESKYPEMFWLAFWSDQIWRAFHVVSFMNSKSFIKAKQMSYGLPYAFINKTWTSFKQEYLHNLYQDLYKIDYSIKRGSTFYSLDLFYLNHFNKFDKNKNMES